VLRWVSLVAVLIAAPSLAAHTGTSYEGGSARWSVESGNTVGAGTDVVYGQFGFPGLSGTFLHGVQSNLDLGARFTFNYGVESDASFIHPELKLQGVSRVNLLKNPKFDLALEFDPGFGLFFAGGQTFFGLALPVELTAGIPINSQFTIDLGFGLPVFINFTTTTYALIPILFGGGVEYYLQSNMALTFRLRMGPEISTISGGGSDFGLQALIGVALKL
jgi:hypothetical protein